MVARFSQLREQAEERDVEERDLKDKNRSRSPPAPKTWSRGCYAILLGVNEGRMVDATDDNESDQP